MNDEKKYKTIFELSPEGIAVLDIKGNVVDVNKKLYDWLGYKREEVLGKNIAEQPFLADKDRALVKKKFSLRIAGEKVPPYEINFVAKEGQNLVGQVIATAMRDEHEEIIGELIIVSDITERKKVEEEIRDSEEKLKMLFDYAPDGYYLSDAKGNFIDGNKAAEKIIGYRRGELIGKNFFKENLLAPKDIPKAIANLAKNVLGKSTGPDEFSLKRKDGNYISVEVSTHPVKIKGKLHVLGIARDITRRKIAELELEEQREKLEEKVHELQEAMKHIKRLEGLVPICANCKKIRLEGKNPEDPKAWTSLETYISDKTDASLTHGLCPECTEKLYGKFLKGKKE
ncbi:MAG: PAS domain-containing protein [Candidatus Omnitrophota bacterium]